MTDSDKYEIKFNEYKEKIEELLDNSFIKFVRKSSTVIIVIVVMLGLYTSMKITNRGGFLHEFVNSPNRSEVRYQKAEDEKYNKKVADREWRVKHYPAWLVEIQDRTHPVSYNHN